MRRSDRGPFAVYSRFAAGPFVREHPAVAFGQCTKRHRTLPGTRFCRLIAGAVMIFQNVGGNRASIARCGVEHYENKHY
jgi:hypothetical protein